MEWGEWAYFGWVALAVAFVLVGVGAIIWLVMTADERRRTRRDSLEHEIRERYARGEIDRSTLERLLGDLHAGG